MIGWAFYPLTKTRYACPATREAVTGDETASAVTIYFGKQPRGHWRFVVDCDWLREVGLQYETKAELLADLPRYAESWGF